MGHHDLMRMFDRALRRAGLPLAYSAGYNPRPQISFPTALALGIESAEEIFEVELVRWTAPRRARERLEKELPEGIGIVSVLSVPHAQKAEVAQADFVIDGVLPFEDMCGLIRAFMDKSEAPVVRAGGSRTKSVNVRKFVETVRVDSSRMFMTLRIGPGGAARPEEVVAAILECPVGDLPDDLMITRTRLRLTAPPQKSGEKHGEKDAHQHGRPGRMPGGCC